MQIGLLERQVCLERPKVARVADSAVERLAANFTASAKHVDLSLVVFERRPKVECALQACGVEIFALSGACGKFDLAGLRRSLDAIKPDVIVTFGWAGLKNLAALDWGVGHGVPVIAASDSNAHDYRRNLPKEFLKSQLLAMFSAVWAAGPEAAAYAAQLGVAEERIIQGPVNTVDWEHFSAGARAAREKAAMLRRELGLPERFFLSVSRLAPEKNIPGLLQAFLAYRQNAGPGAWDLVLVGDGPQRLEIESLIDAFGLRRCTHLTGWQSFEALPAFYGLASSFAIASRRETWAVVVNEAAIAGLPLVVSDRCGSAYNLVRDGVSGYTFPPERPDLLAEALLKLSHGNVDLAAMGRASVEISRDWHPEKHGESLKEVVLQALRLPRPRIPLWKRSALRLAVRSHQGVELV
jgi:glycosyltransferase involved in cell wall biosynthesis